jgi:hypothetical protein
VAKELNSIAYGNDAAKKSGIFGANVFNIKWGFELKNLTTNKVLSKTVPILFSRNGKFKNSKVLFNFPATSDLLQLTLTATITDAYGHSQPKPLEFVFWNQQLETDGSPTQLNNWLNQFLGGKPGYIWVVDHWERVRAGQENKPQPLQITLGYLAEDKVLTLKEVEQLLK